MRSRAIERLPRSSSDVAPRAPISPPRVPAAVDPDDVGAQVGQQHAAERSRPQPGELDDPYALQRSHALLPCPGPPSCDPPPGMLPDAAADGPGGRRAMAYLLAALGGALGALARWGVAEALPASPGGWPWATLLVNLTGCLLLGVLLAVLAARSPEPAWPRPFLAVGVLGGYTTYSDVRRRGGAAGRGRRGRRSPPATCSRRSSAASAAVARARWPRTGRAGAA